MKKFILSLILILSGISVYAQFDERFYNPDKEWIDMSHLSYEEIILFADADTIYSVMLKPEMPAKATVIYFHGNGSNISKWASHVKPLVDDGYQVVMTDYRGFGRSTGTPTHVSIAKDAQMLLDTLFAMEDIKDTDIIIYGVSIGTQAATLMTKNNDDRVSVLILDGAMRSFTDLAVAGSPPENHGTIRKYVTSPYSAIEDIGAIKNAKLMVIHSEEDFIPIVGAREIYDKAETEKIFWQYEGKHVEALFKYPDTFIEKLNLLTGK